MLGLHRVWVSAGGVGSGRLVNVLRAEVDDISPMVGGMISIGVGRHEFVIYYAWLVGVYPVY